MKLAVIIPVYNEEQLAPRLLEKLLRTPAPAAPVQTDEPNAPSGHVPVVRRIYVVDDASADRTLEVLNRFAQSTESGTVTVLRHDRNMGKGAAVRTGLTAALRDGADLLLIQDADLEYDPADHARLVAPILDGRADAVVGTRFGGEAHRVLYFWHYLANRFITLCSNVLTNLNLSDIECCLKAFTREVAQQLQLKEDRFGIEPELVAKFARAKVGQGQSQGLERKPARIFEVAVSYAGRTYAEGKKIGPSDGVAALWCILKYNVIER